FTEPELAAATALCARAAAAHEAAQAAAARARQNMRDWRRERAAHPPRYDGVPRPEDRNSGPHSHNYSEQQARDRAIQYGVHGQFTSAEAADRAAARVDMSRGSGKDAMQVVPVEPGGATLLRATRDESVPGNYRFERTPADRAVAIPDSDGMHVHL